MTVSRLVYRPYPAGRPGPIIQQEANTMLLHGPNTQIYPHNPNGQIVTFSQLQALYHETAQLGANAVALVTDHRVSLEGSRLVPPPESYLIPDLIYPDSGQVADRGWYYTLSPDQLRLYAMAALDMGLTVMLKPHINGHYGWRGYIQVKGPHARAFQSAYMSIFLPRYIELAQELYRVYRDRVILCLGCELVQVTQDLGLAFWSKVIRYARKHYPGPLTYAANAGGSDDGQEFVLWRGLWDRLDYIGLDVYTNLTASYDPAQRPELQDLIDGWDRSWINGVPSFADQLGRVCGGDLGRVVFTEIGYRATDDAYFNPGADPRPGQAPDAGMQYLCWQAALSRWGGSIAGWFPWSYGIYPVPDTYHELRNNPPAARLAMTGGRL